MLGSYECIACLNLEIVVPHCEVVKDWVNNMSDIQHLHRRHIYGRAHQYNHTTLVLIIIIGDGLIACMGVVQAHHQKV